MPTINGFVVSVCFGLTLGTLVATLFAWRSAFNRLTGITIELYKMREELNRINRRMEQESDLTVSELKPCPFCGHRAKVDDCGDHRFFVRCTHCSINQDKLFTQKCDAIKAWNRRVADSG